MNKQEIRRAVIREWMAISNTIEAFAIMVAILPPDIIHRNIIIRSTQSFETESRPSRQT